MYGITRKTIHLYFLSYSVQLHFRDFVVCFKMLDGFISGYV